VLQYAFGVFHAAPRVRYDARDVPFASRMRQIERTPGRALRPRSGPTASSGCCSAPSQRRDNGGEAEKRRWRRAAGEVEGTEREKTKEDRPPLCWPTSRPPQMGRRSGAELEVGSLDPPALEPLAPAIDGPALDLPSWGFSPPGPLDSPRRGRRRGRWAAAAGSTSRPTAAQSGGGAARPRGSLIRRPTRGGPPLGEPRSPDPGAGVKSTVLDSWVIGGEKEREWEGGETGGVKMENVGPTGGSWFGV
jgi:hypothetical protein